MTFHPTGNPKPQKLNFEKLKKIPEDIIILHMCTINDNLMIYGSRVRRTEFSVILDHFLLLYPITTPKIKMMKKWKKSLEILPFYTCVSKMKIICIVPVIWSVTDRIFCHFGPTSSPAHLSRERGWFWTIFCPFTLLPLTTKKIKIFKKWKDHLEISFYTSVP